MMRTALCVWVVSAVLCSGRADHHGDHHGHGHDHGHDHSHPRGKGHRHSHDHHPQPQNDSLPVTQGNGEFAFRLYKHLVAQPDSQGKNVFFSPLSVSLALAALSVGARGQTHQQLFSGLGFNSSMLTQADVDQAFSTILTKLNQKPGVDLSAGSALFLQNTFKPRPEFLEDLKKFYLSEGLNVDFTNTTETTDIINKYVGEKTHGKIDTLVKDLDPTTIMYLLSYIYFKGKWAVPFDPEDTKEGTFHVDNQTTVQVQMMNVEKKFDVYYDQEISTIILHLYYNESVSMMLALPEQGLASLEEVICMDHLIKWHRKLKARDYSIYLPKLSITTTYSLNNVLNGMGMPDIFSTAADFSGISEDQMLSVSEVVHQASLDVDEAGATAAAATSVTLQRILLRPRTLKFDRPFMVLILDRDTNSILFMGKITNPTNQ